MEKITNEIYNVAIHLPFTDYTQLRFAILTDLPKCQTATLYGYKESVKILNKDVSEYIKLNIILDDEIFNYLVDAKQLSYLTRIPKLKNNITVQVYLKIKDVDCIPQELLLYFYKKCI